MVESVMCTIKEVSSKVVARWNACQAHSVCMCVNVRVCVHACAHEFACACEYARAGAARAPLRRQQNKSAVGVAGARERTATLIVSPCG
jgi:hypothetical protein